jgi:DNA (cytosine-5)-methyltransferase 1
LCREGSEKELKAIDLFCGAGGLSLGLKRAGFGAALSVDNWSAAQEAFACNFPEVPFLLADIDQLQGADLLDSAGMRGEERPTLIAGGPPCQGFSSAGKRKPKDPRNTLVGTFARLVAELMPPFFLFENVEGFLTTGRGSAIFALLDPILEAGYQTHLFKVNAANYGVPQLRKRVIAIGALGMEPSFPALTHSAFGAPGAHLAGRLLPRTPTIQETIGDLEKVPTCLDGHVREPLEGLDLQRSVALKPGQTMRDLPIDLQHESYFRRANRRVRDGMPTERRGGAPAGLRRLRPDEPSKAITGSAISEFLHPLLDGFLTIRECARLQTFPDEFGFMGTKNEQALLIGNAVPPRLAEAFGRSLFRDYRPSQVNEILSTGGKLLTFSPTLSAGMSPILTEIVVHVKKRYGVGTGDMMQAQLPLYA